MQKRDVHQVTMQLRSEPRREGRQLNDLSNEYRRKSEDYIKILSADARQVFCCKSSGNIDAFDGQTQGCIVPMAGMPAFHFVAYDKPRRLRQFASM